MTLRCPSCSEPVNAFMGRCPRCAEDLVANPPVRRDSHGPLCRDRFLRLLVLGAALLVVVSAIVAVVLVQIGGTGSSHRPGTPSVLHARTRSTLVYTFDQLRVVDADTGRSRTLRMPTSQGGASDATMLRFGRSLLLNRGNTAWLYPPGLNGPPLNLGPSLRLIPGPQPDQVWLWSPDASHVQLIDSSGRQIGPAAALPSGWFPTSDTAAEGLVILPVISPPNSRSSNPNNLEVWDPVSNRVIRGFRDAAMIAAHGHQVAWTDIHCPLNCVLHLTDLRTQAEQDLPLPSGTVGVGGGAFSPDGATLAVPVAVGSAPNAPIAMALVALRMPTITLLPDSEQTPNPNFGDFPPTWSSTGWLFFTAYGSTQVLAWRPGYRRAVMLAKASIPGLPPTSPGGQQLPNLIAL